MQVASASLRLLRCRRRGWQRAALLLAVAACLTLLAVRIITTPAAARGASLKDEEKDAERFSSMPSVSGERRNLAYVKVFKAASQTLSSMFRRFGLRRNLTFAMPLPRRIYLGWPLQMRREFIVTLPGVRRPSILVDHCVYNRTFLDELMAKPCAYIASVREPFAQVQSLFVYYNIANISGLTPRADAFSAYMLNLTAMEAEYKSHARSGTRYCIPDNYSMTQNTMSRVLGFREGVDEPGDFVSRIVNEFDLIIVTELFAESMVLLKRLMRWTHKDVLFEPQNVIVHRQLTPNEAPQVARTHRRWSPVDYLLYDAALRRLRRRIGAEGASFTEELRHFRRVLADARRHCRRLREGVAAGSLSVASSRWSPAFSVDSDDCRSFREENSATLQRISERVHTGGTQHLPYFC